MKILRKSGIGARMLGVAAIACLALVLVGVLSAAAMRADRYDDRRAATRAQVQTAMGVVRHYGELETKGALGRAQAQAAALGVLKGLRYGSGDYFWVNDEKARMIMYPVKPEPDGTGRDRRERHEGSRRGPDLPALRRDRPGRRHGVRVVAVAQTGGEGPAAEDQLCGRVPAVGLDRRIRRLHQ